MESEVKRVLFLRANILIWEILDVNFAFYRRFSQILGTPDGGKKIYKKWVERESESGDPGKFLEEYEGRPE